MAAPNCISCFYSAMWATSFDFSCEKKDTARFVVMLQMAKKQIVAMVKIHHFMQVCGYAVVCVIFVSRIPVYMVCTCNFY